MHTATMLPVTGEQKPSARAVRDANLAVTADPVLGFEFVKADLGISHATFQNSPSPTTDHPAFDASVWRAEI